MNPIIGSGAEEMRIQIGSNHYPTLRQLPDGWVLDIKPDRMPLAVAVLEMAVAVLLAALLISQVVPR